MDRKKGRAKCAGIHHCPRISGGGTTGTSFPTLLPYGRILGERPKIVSLNISAADGSLIAT